MKLNLDTIILFVKDVNALKLFYADILDLEITEETKSEWVVLKAGNSNIGLHKIGEQFLGQSKEAFHVEGNTKIVFETDEDICKVREQLLQKKVKIKEIKTFEGYDYLLCDGEDPEGNVFQLKQKKH
jgi:catechol-2,3-dioxygenase